MLVAFLAAHDVQLQLRYLQAGSALHHVDTGDWSAAVETATLLVEGAARDRR